MKWTKEVPKVEGAYLHQNPKGHMRDDRAVKCSYFCAYDMKVHPNFPPEGWWYMGPIPEPGAGESGEGGAT